MILFDTSVIIDACDPASPWHAWAKERIAAAAPDGAVNAVVVAEASVRAVNRDQLPRDLAALGLALLPLPVAAATPAAAAFAVYLDRLKAEGKAQLSKIPLGDFLIGAHAQTENCPLVTRDPGRVKTYFPGVKLITP